LARRRALDRAGLARKVDRGARAGLAMLAARAAYRRFRRGSQPAPPEAEPPSTDPAVDDQSVARLRGELAEELDRRARRERPAAP
jgi:hypothetical protein